MDESSLFGGIPVDDALARVKARKKSGQHDHNKLNVSAKSDRTWEGRVYDSKLEMNMHRLLLEHFRPDQVKTQVRFILQPAYRLDHVRDKNRALVYTADFVLGELLGEGEDIRPGRGCMVIDAKGMVMPAFVIGAKLFEYRHRMPVYVVKNAKQMLEKINEYKTIMNANATIIDVITSGAPYWIRGYRNSEGRVADLKVYVAGRQGYLALVRESLAELNDIVRDEEFDEPTWEEAMHTVATSLSKKLQEVEEESAAYQAPTNESFTQVTPDVMVASADPQQIVALRLEVLETIVTEPAPEGAPKKSKPTVRARRVIEDQLPIRRYLHRVNLYPGKFTAVEPA